MAADDKEEEVWGCGWDWHPTQDLVSQHQWAWVGIRTLPTAHWVATDMFPSHFRFLKQGNGAPILPLGQFGIKRDRTHTC